MSQVIASKPIEWAASGSVGITGSVDGIQLFSATYSSRARRGGPRDEEPYVLRSELPGGRRDYRARDLDQAKHFAQQVLDRFLVRVVLPVETPET
jgi:hypothetical protein